MRAARRSEQVQLRPEKRASTSFLTPVWKARYFYLALLPAVLLLIVFEWYPAMSAMYNSLFRWNGGNQHTYIGLENYQRLMDDRAFIESLKNVGLFVAFRAVAQTVLPFIAAELIINLRNKFWAERWKVIFVVPMVAPYLLMLLLWRFIYSPQLGLLNQTLEAAGLGDWSRAWLSDPDTAIWALALVRFPWLATLQFLILLGALQKIPRDIMESTQIDGASVFARIRDIDIPLIMPQIKLVVLLTIIFMVQRFELFLVLTDGGPGYATMVPALHLYHSAFTYLEFGYASAIGVVLFVVLLASTILTLRFRREQEEIQ